MRELRQHLLALGNQRVDAHIERRAARQRLALGAALVAKDPREIGIEPIRVFALHGWRRSAERAGIERRPLRFGQRRGRKALAAAQRRDGGDIKPALAMQHAEQHRARARLAHEPAGRRLAAQRVIDQAGNCGAVGRAGETVRQAPVLEHVNSRPPPCFDVGEDFNGAG